MRYYKIKNITNNLPKRHVHKDMTVKIEYHVGFLKKYHSLTSGNEMLTSCRTLPASVHSLRAKKLIITTEISENEFNKLQKPSAKKTIVKDKIEDVKKEVKKRGRKPTTTKSPVEKEETE